MRGPSLHTEHQGHLDGFAHVMWERNRMYVIVYRYDGSFLTYSIQ